MSFIKNKMFKTALVMLAGGLILSNILIIAPKVFALTYLVKPEVILTNMNATGASAVIIEFTTSASNTGTTLTLNFTGWTGGAAGAVAGSQAVSPNYNGVSCTTITGAASYLPGSPAATGSSSTITFSGITAYTASHSYCAVLTGSAVTNPTSVNTYPAVLTAGTDAAANVAVDVITNDQVVVSATVPATFTLALSGNTDAFTANLASGSVGTTTGITCTLSTNGTGWYLYGIESGAGLVSASSGHTITSTSVGTNTTLSAGTEGYLTGEPSGSTTPGTGGGSVTLAVPYSSSGLGNGAGIGNTQLRTLASYTVGPTSGATVVVKEFAAISAITPAASDYTDTITLVGAGTF